MIRLAAILSIALPTVALPTIALAADGSITPAPGLSTFRHKGVVLDYKGLKYNPCDDVSSQLRRALRRCFFRLPSGVR